MDMDMDMDMHFSDLIALIIVEKIIDNIYMYMHMNWSSFKCT